MNPTRIVLVLALNLAWLAVPGAARSEVMSGAYCLKQVVHIELGQVVPPLVGTPMVHAGVTHLAYIENLTDQSVRVEVPIHYWGDYRVWGSRAMQIEQGGASPRERIDTVALGYVTVPPNTKRRLMAIEIGRPQDVFRYPPEPADVVRTPEYELVPSGVKCVLEGSAMRQSQARPPGSPPPPQEARARPYEAPETKPQIAGKDDGAPMVLVQAGEYSMGSDAGDSDEKPIHKVALPAFYIDKFEVTQALYKKFYQFAKPEKKYWVNYGHQADDQPVTYVTWSGADAYCRYYGKRLPTEAEWEKAARGTDGRTYPWGEELPSGQLAGFDGSSLMSAGSFQAGKSPYGAYDLAGSVWEWVADWYDDHYYQSSPPRSPKGPESGRWKVLRGGSHRDGKWQLRTSRRRQAEIAQSDRDIGFRCAKDAP